MSLEEYNKKRNFEVTSEPMSGQPSGEKRIFVVQWHDSSHLHFDFRLELDGVLKSWAVPKGPSMNHKDKRLAVMVEDHPLDYANFEGIIPKGEYGAGTVKIWDKGYWMPEENIQENPSKALDEGVLKFTLEGQKLKGSFVLIRMKKVKNGWILVKEKDKYMVEDIYDAYKLE